MYPRDYLYSLHVALVGINVPNDKARAVVDDMERDMGTTIATKADLQLRRKDLELLSSTLTIGLGSLLMLGLGLLFAALKLT